MECELKISFILILIGCSSNESPLNFVSNMPCALRIPVSNVLSCLACSLPPGSYVLRVPRFPVPQVLYNPRAPAPHVLRVLNAFVPKLSQVLLALVPHVPHTLRSFAPNVPRAFVLFLFCFMCSPFSPGTRVLYLACSMYHSCLLCSCVPMLHM